MRLGKTAFPGSCADAVVLAGLCVSGLSALGQARPASGSSAVVAFSHDGVLSLATNTGHIVSTIRADRPIGEFDVSPDLAHVVFAEPHPGRIGGPLFLLEVATGRLDRIPPDPFVNPGNRRPREITQVPSSPRTGSELPTPRTEPRAVTITTYLVPSSFWTWPLANHAFCPVRLMSVGRRVSAWRPRIGRQTARVSW